MTDLDVSKLTELARAVYERTYRVRQHPLEEFTEAFAADEEGKTPPPKKEGSPSWMIMHPDLAAQLGLGTPEDE